MCLLDGVNRRSLFKLHRDTSAPLQDTEALLGQTWKTARRGEPQQCRSMLHAGRASQRESRLTARTLYNALVAFPKFIITPYSLMYDKKSCRCQVTTGLCQGSLFQASSPVSSSVYFQKLLRVPCFKIQEVGTLPSQYMCEIQH